MPQPTQQYWPAMSNFFSSKFDDFLSTISIVLYVHTVKTYWSAQSTHSEFIILVLSDYWYICNFIFSYSTRVDDTGIRFKVTGFNQKLPVMTTIDSLFKIDIKYLHNNILVFTGTGICKRKFYLDSIFWNILILCVIYKRNVWFMIFFYNRSCLIYFWMQCLSILVMMSCFPLWGTKWRETSSMPSSNPQNLSGNCLNIYRCANLYKSLDIHCNIKIFYH